MSAESARGYVKRHVKPLLPTTWVFKDGDLPEVVNKPTVSAFLRSVIFTPEAPQSGSLDAEFDLVIQVPQQLSMGPIEDALLDLLFALRKVPNLRVTAAVRESVTTPGVKVIYSSFTVTVTVTFNP